MHISATTSPLSWSPHSEVGYPSPSRVSVLPLRLLDGSCMEEDCSTEVQTVVLNSRIPQQGILICRSRKFSKLFAATNLYLLLEFCLTHELDYLLNLKTAGLSLSSSQVYLPALTAFTPLQPHHQEFSAFTHLFATIFIKGLFNLSSCSGDYSALM